MKQLLIALLIGWSGFALAEDAPETNWSKFQANFYFKCTVAPDCIKAYSELMSAPEIAENKFEAALYGLAHNGWDDATHVMRFYFKDANEYMKAGQVFSASPAMQKFLAAGREAGNEAQYQTLTTHTIMEGNPMGTKASLRWSIKVTDPATFVPAWTKMAAELADKPWGGKAYGLQTYYLGNTGTITHEIWVAFDSPAAGLVFLEEFPKTAEWQAYNEEVNDSVSLVRSYMELTAISLNED
jgi:hypothetical protein